MKSMYKLTPLFMAILLVITFIGFWPSFFSRLGEAPLTHLLHGFTSTIWIVILGAQAWLINAHKPSIHRTLGITGLMIAPIMIAGFAMINLDSAHRTAQGASMFAKLFSAPLMIFDLMFLPITLGLIYLALKYRKNLAHHAALMILTCFALIGPSLSRLLVNYVPGFLVTGPDTMSNFSTSLWFSMLLTIVCIGIIALKTKVERKVWLTAFFIYLITFILYLSAGQTEVWKEFVISLSALNYATVFWLVLVFSTGIIWLGWEQGKAVKRSIKRHN